MTEFTAFRVATFLNNAPPNVFSQKSTKYST